MGGDVPTHDPWDVGPIQGVARRWLSGKQDDCSGETSENDLAQFLHGLFFIL